MLKVCPTCDGADTDLRPCHTCKGVRMVPDSPAGDADDEPRRTDLGLPSPGAHAMFEARKALKEAATNYAAALLLSGASADHVNKAFDNLEEAATEYATVRLSPAGAASFEKSKRERKVKS